MKRIIELLLLFFAYQLAVKSVFTGLFMLWNRSMELPNPNSSYYITFLLIAQVAFSLFLSAHLLVGDYVRLDVRKSLSQTTPCLWLLFFVLIIGLGLWNNYFNELADLPNTNEHFLASMMQHPLGIVGTVIMAPIMEELLFRGAMQGYLLSKWKNPLWAILISSFLFGVVHGNPAQIPFAFCIGIGLGWVYYKTKNLLACIFMHLVNNGSTVLIFWLSDQSDATLIGTLGMKWASVLALLGIIFTIVGVVGIAKFSKNKPVLWYE